MNQEYYVVLLVKTDDVEIKTPHIVYDLGDTPGIYENREEAEALLHYMSIQFPDENKYQLYKLTPEEITQ